MGAPDAELARHLAELFDFFTGFVDRCHHGKEEDALFPELERLGVHREGGPIGVLLAEHEAGRQRVRAMSDGLEWPRRGESEAQSAIHGNAAAYRDLLRAHIKKEDDVIFPLAESLIPEQVSSELTDKFEEIERSRVGAGRHEAYHAMLRALKTRYGVR